MPDEQSTGLQHPREFGNDASIVGGIDEEAKGREEVDYDVEAIRPRSREAPHVSTGVPEIGRCSPRMRNRQQITRQVDSAHVVTCFSQKMRVTSLPAGNVEYQRSYWQAHYVDQSRDLATILLKRE